MGHIREFDGLRGLLALWVFFAHALELGPYSSLSGHLRPQFAVEIFIVLSGFVIFYLLSRGEDYGVFITRRFFRLFPVFAVCFLFALVLRALLQSHDEVAFGLPTATPHLQPYLTTHAFMLHGAVPEQWLPLSSEAVLPPAWSISLEWQFYLLAPFLFCLLIRPSWRLALVLFALVAMRALWMRHSLGLLVPGGPRDLTFNMDAFLPLKLEYFAVGVASWLLWSKIAPSQLEPGKLSWLAVLGAPVAWCLTGSLSLALWFLLFCLLLAARAASPTGVASRVSGFLCVPWVRRLGLISYPLYLVHVPTLVLVRHGLQRFHLGSGHAAFAGALIVGALALSIGLASLLHVTIEKPLIAFGKRISARPQAAADTQPAPVV